MSKNNQPKKELYARNNLSFKGRMLVNQKTNEQLEAVCFLASDQLAMWALVFVIFRISDVFFFDNILQRFYEIYEILTKELTKFQVRSRKEDLLQRNKKKVPVSNLRHINKNETMSNIIQSSEFSSQHFSTNIQYASYWGGTL